MKNTKLILYQVQNTTSVQKFTGKDAKKEHNSKATKGEEDFIGLIKWFIAGATVIFCTKWLNRPGPTFKGASNPQQTTMPELGFKSGTSCPVTNALTTRNAGGQIPLGGKVGENKKK